MSAVPDPTDAELLAMISRRDQAAMNRFYQRFAGQALAFARRHLRNDAEAEDVVVETMMDVWRQAERFRGDAQVRTWLFGIVRNKALERVRRQGNRQYVDIELVAESIEDDGAEEGYKRLLASEQAHHVVDCLGTLSMEHRECLHLVFFEDMPLADVARLQRVPENTVKTRVFHAKRGMRKCLEQRLAGGR